MTSTTTPNSIWLGSITPTINNRDVWATRRDEELYRLIVEEGRPLLLCGRNSTSSGRAGCRNAVADGLDAAEDLARNQGFDIRSSLPPADELVEVLMASPNKVWSVGRDGRRFLNRFVLIDLAELGIVISLSAGSAKKVDADLNQPHVNWVQRLLREIEPAPAGFLVKRFDRLSRTVWQTGKVVEELREVERKAGSVWAADVEFGRWSTREDADALHAMRGQAASTEAAMFRRKTVRGVLNLTEREMVDGRAFYALSGGIPPGLFSYRERRSGRSVLAIDSPAIYPDAADVEKYLPNVRDQFGELVDQAETIRWFIREYAQPGVTTRQLFNGLLQRRFSTHALRQRRDQGPDAYFGGPSKRVAEYRSDAGEVWVRSILANIDMYETGVLARRFGSEEEAEVVITNVFPPQGSWGDPEDFDRIRHKMRNNAARAAAYIEWSWSGMPIMVDGDGANLKPRRSRVDAADVCWNFTRRTSGRQAEGGDGARASKTPPMPDSVLTSAIVDALVAANGKPLERYVAEDRFEDDTELLRRRVAAVLQEIESKSAAQDKRYSVMMGLDPSSSTQARLFERAQREYYEFDESIERLRRQEAELRRKLEAVEGQRVGLDVDSLSALISGLRNPYTNRYRTELRQAIHGLTATTRRFTRAKLVGVEVIVSGSLVIDAEDGPFAVPFEATHTVGAAAEADARALRALGLLRSGRVARYVGEGQTHASSALVAELLGVKSTRFALSACNDPDLLRLGMAVMFPSPAPGEDPASVPTLGQLQEDPDLRAQFGDVPALAARIRSVYENLRSQQWLSVRGGRYETAALIRAATDQGGELASAEDAKAVRHMQINLQGANNTGRRERWIFRPGQWPELEPCPHCGGTVAASMRIREATDYVCLEPECRRDGAGVRWPKRFDVYISNLPDWLEAGFTPDVPADSLPTARELAGNGSEPVVKKSTKWRQLDDLTADDRHEIAEAYADRRRTVKDIQTEYRVSLEALYSIVEGAGLTPRRPTTAKWAHREVEARTRSAERDG